MPHHILEKALELKVFQIWELTHELEKDWGFLLTGKQIKDRVRVWIGNNLSTGFLVKVMDDPPMFTVRKYEKEWREHLRLRACPVCGKKFLPRKSQTLYCSETCANRRYAKIKWRRVKPEKRKPRKWTEEELNLLKGTAQKKGKLSARDMRELARLLNRTFKAVQHKYYEEVSNRGGKR